MLSMSTSAADTATAYVVPEWSLGDRLRKIRRTVGLSQAEFAARLDENQKTYAAWELDTSAPRNVVTVARRIEMATGVPAAWVLGVAATSANHPGSFGQYHDESDGVVVPFPQVRAALTERWSTGSNRLVVSGEHRPAS